MTNPISRLRRSAEGPFPGLKLISIVALGLLLLIPLAMIRGLVDERRIRSSAVADEIRELWGGYQTVNGPLLKVPYRYRWTDEEGQPREGVADAWFLPEELTVSGELEPEIRSRGIYSVSLFMASLAVEGRFARPDGAALGIEDADLLIDQARIYVSVTDPRGIRNASALRWSETEIELEPGADPFGHGTGAVWAPVDLEDSGEGDYGFSLDLDLACGGSLSLVPVGRRTTVDLESGWSSPSYGGAYLPVSHSYGDEGFDARWEVTALGRSFPMSWRSADTPHTALASSAFGVEFFDPVDIYARNERAVKYGFLFILIPFLVFIMAELLGERRIHPLQYLLAVSANLIFFLLLLSLSEHIPFAVAFFAAAGGATAELSLYARHALGGRRMGFVMLLSSTGLYGFLFTALQSEDYALLIASAGLFLILGAVMYLTRRIVWYAAD